MLARDAVRRVGGQECHGFIDGIVHAMQRADIAGQVRLGRRAGRTEQYQPATMTPDAFRRRRSMDEAHEFVALCRAKGAGPPQAFALTSPCLYPEQFRAAKLRRLVPSMLFVDVAGQLDLLHRKPALDLCTVWMMPRIMRTRRPHRSGAWLQCLAFEARTRGPRANSDA
jgi:hypothetical protein